MPTITIFQMQGLRKYLSASLYTGLFPTRTGIDFGRFPLIWDYAKFADYKTFMFVPYPLSWADFRALNSETGKTSLDYLFDVTKTSIPRHYEDCIRDDKLIDLTSCGNNIGSWC